ncbi:HET domain-containing protein [Colletotrichum graminicola M1.001]|uniref:HET domain-containing protein n=1 Tax=Colletotrichum graminicola (strain M1.001 / M2 / FGSC 10212) TaxID=645133 RepID=E3QWW1_COLGM|nr:HET domain-containing protein [Colletotrichum graminicola M1.001]EFQ35349.1 HET domain-containing protein [Colletotrichum graminicola M1.001]
MGRIYSTAHSTVIHLGDLTPDVSGVFPAPSASTSGASVGNSGGIAVENERSVLAKSWFRRVWVLQELVLSKDPWVQCGNQRIRWKDFCRYFLGTGAGNSQRLHDGDAALRVLSDMNFSRTNNARLPLHRAIQVRRGLGATDPRDFVYASLGIISDLHVVNKYLQVDYSMSLTETFGKVARYMFDQLGVEKAIALTDLESTHPVAPLENRRRLARDRIPSWSPDWTRDASYTIPMYKDKHLNHMRLKGMHHVFTDGELPLVLGHIVYDVDTIESLHSMPSGDRSSYLTVEYEQAKIDLRNLYKNTHASGDKFDSYRHVPLKDREARHETLCNITGRTWTRFFEDHVETAEHIGLVKSFVQWTSAQATKKREFVGSGTRGLIELLFKYLEVPKGRSALDGRCLVFTRSGNLGVAPRSAKPGDHVMYLAGSETAVVLRPRSGLGMENIERALLQKLRQPGYGAVSVADQNGENELWRVPEQGDVPISHFDVVGEGYLDDYTGWSLKYPPKASEMRLFALH